MRIKNSPLKRLLWSMFCDLMINANFGRPAGIGILDKSRNKQGKVWDSESETMIPSYIENYWDSLYPYFPLSNRDMIDNLSNLLQAIDGTSVYHNNPTMHDCDGRGFFMDMVVNPSNPILISMKIKDMILDGNDRCVLNESANPRYIKALIKAFEKKNVYFTTVGLIDDKTLKVTCINITKLMKMLKDDYRSPVSGNKVLYTVTRRSGSKRGYIQLSFKPSAILKRDGNEKAQIHHDKCLAWYCDKGVAFCENVSLDASHKGLKRLFKSIL